MLLRGSKFKNTHWREFPGGPVLRTRRFHCCSLGSIPGQGTKIPQAVWSKNNKQTNKQISPQNKNKQNTGKVSSHPRPLTKVSGKNFQIYSKHIWGPGRKQMVQSN